MQEKLEALCEELLRSRPNQEKVRQLMTEVEIPYNPDPIQQLASVLELMNHTKPQTKANHSDRAVEI